MIRILSFVFLAAVITLSGCGLATEIAEQTNGQDTISSSLLLDKYTAVRLDASLDHLSEQQQQMVATLIEAADRMNELFWYEAYGQDDSLLNTKINPPTREFIDINYGPWDRLNGNEPFVQGVGGQTTGRELLSDRHDQRRVRPS